MTLNSWVFLAVLKMLRFLDSLEECWSANEIMDPDLTVKNRRNHSDPSHLPPWVWFIVTKFLGIHCVSGTAPVFGTVIHSLNFAFALGFVVSHVWRVAYDIASTHTKQDVTNGSVSIFIVFCWSAYGFYSKHLCRRLISHPHILKDVHMHSRTLFKIHTTLLVFLLGVVFTVVSSYNGVSVFCDGTCLNINLSPLVCKVEYISRVLFSSLTLIWSSLVAFVLISVCRTHTIGIRKFIKSIEYDAALHAKENIHTNQFLPVTNEDIFQESVWLEDELPNKDSSEDFILHTSPDQFNFSNQLQSSYNPDFEKQNTPSGTFLLPSEDVHGLFENYFKRENFHHNDSVYSVTGQGCKPFPSSSHEMETFLEADTSPSNEKTYLCPEDILRGYWKISCRLRFLSSAFQRWLASYISLVVFWCCVYLVYWVNNAATAYDIVQFVVPLIILPLLCSALAEVNLEGQRLSKVYGYAMNYGTIMTVLFAILVAFTSRLIVAEINN
ncbi:uncharacterized protein LOC106474369 isoform X2 [Limulus polyphemus]|uniref:Uncharacterized protein LOC106474369 isoform X2 n=1 Tax=Limulus polyphemus TaxID=6850 RepID=A0ABM1TR83_LIMPO|nr:uncharacterized protein LOC106474369 isoform X2 [Limulus polyphemus]